MRAIGRITLENIIDASRESLRSFPIDHHSCARNAEAMWTLPIPPKADHCMLAGMVFV
jgi:hypothetical protein